MDEFKPFSPSIDWSNGLRDSLIWIGEASAITALGTLVVLTLIARFTIWGRQFWAVTGAYFTGGTACDPGFPWAPCCCR
jgi:vitamin B12/bleomycin/antimicrobial peptide transport system ATP-binding/permease protein